MNRPLLPQDRTEVEIRNLEAAQSPGVSNLVAATLFQMGLLLGGYPTGQVRVILESDTELGTLIMQVSMTVPLEELEA